MKNGKAMITKKRILEFVANRYFAIGSTGESGYPESLYYVTDFLNNLWLDEAKKGSAVYNRGGINNLSIDYGDPDQDYDVQISFKTDWSRYTVEVNGETITDWDNIPQLKLSYENFDYIFKQWVKIKEQNSKYVIITQDDFGWIGLQGKQELDADESELVEQYQSKK